MNKKQMAEWLAENVLGWTYCKKCKTWVSPDVTGDIVKFINSPDGFFAVWDKCVSEDLESLLLEVLDVDKEGNETWKCELFDHKETGRDRYEAFYNAVYEAWKQYSREGIVYGHFFRRCEND